MDIRTYLELLLRRKVLIIAVFLLAIATAVVATNLQHPTYAAQALLRISPPFAGTVDYAEMVYTERATNTFIRILTGWPVMNEISSRLGISDKGLEQSIKVQTIRDTELVSIYVENADPQMAQAIAATLVDIAIEQNQRPSAGRATQDTQAEQLQTLQKELEAARETLSSAQSASPPDQEAVDDAQGRVRVLEEVYGLLLREYEQARLREALRANSISVIEPAGVSSTPVKPNRQQNIALGGLLGLLAGVGLAFLAESFNKAVRTIEELEGEINVKVLGMIPRLGGKSVTPEIIMANARAGRSVEAYRLLRANLQAMDLTSEWKTLLFTSASPSEGKSTVVANLAVAAAQAKQHVVLVDADFRRASLHKIFGLSNYRGLSQALGQGQSVLPLLRTTEFEGLKVLTSGPPPSNPDAVLDPRKVRTVLSELSRTFDLVLFDGPPALLVADASFIAPIFDGVVIVAKYGQTSPRDLRRLATQLSGVKANVIGTVLNGLQAGGNNHYYHNEAYESNPPVVGVS